MTYLVVGLKPKTKKNVHWTREREQYGNAGSHPSTLTLPQYRARGDQGKAWPAQQSADLGYGTKKDKNISRMPPFTPESMHKALLAAKVGSDMLCHVP